MRRKKKLQEICDPVKPEFSGVAEVQCEEDDRQRNEKKLQRRCILCFGACEEEEPRVFFGVAQWHFLEPDWKDLLDLLERNQELQISKERITRREEDDPVTTSGGLDQICEVLGS
ncbi:hypothetical protein U1Q18_043036 [Sarracenia purpurea var. burkii]